MSINIYNIVAFVLIAAILWGIRLMNSPRTAVHGNLLGAIAMLGAIVLTLIRYEVLTFAQLWIPMIIGSAVGYYLAMHVAMIQMPQMVAAFNGLGGGASALVALVTVFDAQNLGLANNIAASLTLLVGGLTFSGSFIAAAKLHGRMSPRPIALKGHTTVIFVLILSMVALVVVNTLTTGVAAVTGFTFILLLSLIFGVVFTIRVGGGDMPVTISLLNSLSGLASSLAGFVISDPLLVAVGAIVGSAGLILTQIMCRAMNRSLLDILSGRTSVATRTAVKTMQNTEKCVQKQNQIEDNIKTVQEQTHDLSSVLKSAQSVIIVPGYGMAVAQAQHQVKTLMEQLETQGAEVRFAIHPVAGRMPGHMNVLLAEVDVPYEKLFELDDINPDFADTDLVIVVGANDVVNPAAMSAEGTPIYGMPVLHVDQAKHVIICNYDTKPGYAGVKNPLYEAQENTILVLGDAKDTVNSLIQSLKEETPSQTSMDKMASSDDKHRLSALLQEANSVVIVPGYGMAVAQAQHEVKMLMEQLDNLGANVRFAIHPVAGRMPGHMNVLLAEADVPYEKLYEMDDINPEFPDTDLVIVVGANDVINPAAMSAEGTPIYGMPVLRVDQAKHTIICNYDTKPGYAGVNNPLYETQESVTLVLGDAKDTVKKLLKSLTEEPKEAVQTANAVAQGPNLSTLIKQAHSAIIVPGYGMAVAQAQHQVKTLMQQLENNGADVRFAIHPVAGRMPGHMNVLLAEADVPYEKLYEMDDINPDFADTDLVIVIGANDVINPAAMSAEGTPIYGMPVMRVDQAKHIVICNFDTKPGYAGVDNPLYDEQINVSLLLGDAKDTVNELLEILNSEDTASDVQEVCESSDCTLSSLLTGVRSAIIVPGYGMAVAQAQHKVRKLMEQLEATGAKVCFAIHPVAGRMPGHMNVLLAEADVPYEKLIEMDDINPEFANTDLVVVVGANDVINPAAMSAEGTPIYGMPVMRVDQAKNIIICNYDTKPGYAGVENPLYDGRANVKLILGDAKEGLDQLLTVLESL